MHVRTRRRRGRHQRFVGVRDDPARAADDIRVVGKGCGLPGLGAQVDVLHGPHQVFQLQIGPGRADVGAIVGNDGGVQAHHRDVGAALIEVRFGDVEAPGRLRRVVPLPSWLVIVVLDLRGVREAFAIHPRHRERLVPPHAVERDVDPIHLLDRHVAHQLHQKWHDRGIGPRSDCALSRSDGACERANAVDEGVEMFGGGLDLCHGLLVSPGFEGVSASGMAQPDGHRERAAGDGTDVHLELPGERPRGERRHVDLAGMVA